MAKNIDITGQRFGRFVVLKRTSRAKNGDLRYLCICDCGTQKVVLAYSLKSGHTKSCGCLKKEKAFARIKHGHSTKETTSKTYRSWNSMIQRCTNPNNKSYCNYGGRGITVCERWKKFTNFLIDMGERPSSKHQIDRIDNNQGYCKENCKWSTRKEQNRNKRDNTLLIYDGKTQCLIEWAEECGIKPTTIAGRLHRGWPIDKALTTPVG